MKRFPEDYLTDAELLLLAAARFKDCQLDARSPAGGSLIVKVGSAELNNSRHLPA